MRSKGDQPSLAARRMTIIRARGVAEHRLERSRGRRECAQPQPEPAPQAWRAKARRIPIGGLAPEGIHAARLKRCLFPAILPRPPTPSVLDPPPAREEGKGEVLMPGGDSRRWDGGARAGREQGLAKQGWEMGGENGARAWREPALAREHPEGPSRAGCPVVPAASAAPA